MVFSEFYYGSFVDEWWHDTPIAHVRESIKTVMDSAFHAVGFLIPGT